ncbi:hypothetical protein F5051DRAFT_404629 [Lentinula edodes]|nr:hypothetical protein F5051DRAFT_404629 [Lentinula edodes]
MSSSGSPSCLISSSISSCTLTPTHNLSNRVRFVTMTLLVSVPIQIKHLEPRKPCKQPHCRSTSRTRNNGYRPWYGLIVTPSLCFQPRWQGRTEELVGSLWPHGLIWRYSCFGDTGHFLFPSWMNLVLPIIHRPCYDLQTLLSLRYCIEGSVTSPCLSGRPKSEANSTPNRSISVFHRIKNLGPDHWTL